MGDYRLLAVRLGLKFRRPDGFSHRKNILGYRRSGIVPSAVGPTDLMEFARFDLAVVLRKELGERAPQVLRLVAGNPLIMRQMVKLVPDAGSYAPVTILIDERPDGVHLSYDRMVSFLASYGNSN